MNFLLYFGFLLNMPSSTDVIITEPGQYYLRVGYAEDNFVTYDGCNWVDRAFLPKDVNKKLTILKVRREQTAMACDFNRLGENITREDLKYVFMFKLNLKEENMPFTYRAMSSNISMKAVKIP